MKPRSFRTAGTSDASVSAPRSGLDWFPTSQGHGFNQLPVWCRPSTLAALTPGGSKSRSVGPSGRRVLWGSAPVPQCRCGFSSAALNSGDEECARHAGLCLLGIRSLFYLRHQCLEFLRAQLLPFHGTALPLARRGLVLNFVCVCPVSSQSAPPASVFAGHRQACL